MESAYLIATITLALFAILGIYDGLYLHIIRYKLHTHLESRLEHLTHTVRALLFPGILYTLMLHPDDIMLFWLGMALVAADMVVLMIDAFMEKDSRAFMGGLPRGEYMLHLMVNGFHFATVAVLLATQLDLSGNELAFKYEMATGPNAEFLRWLALNLLPGAVGMGVLHVWVGVKGNRVTILNQRQIE
jgi:hypothetical protein